MLPLICQLSVFAFFNHENLYDGKYIKCVPYS